MTTTHAPEPRSAIEAAGSLPDLELDIATVALQLARVDAPKADWRKGAAHFSDIARKVVQAASMDSKADAGDLEARRLILAETLHGHFGYQGDSETYEDMANANLIRVVERRRGLPVALGILWLHAADAAGWAAFGVDFPGHFLLALEGPKGKLILDVFAGGKVLEAQDLRALLKRVEGEKAELRPGVLRPMTRREVLLRLQNNIKLRRLRGGDVKAALSATEDMLRLAPDQAALWREAGLMNQRLERIGAALGCLDRFLELVPEGEAAARVRALAGELRQRLN
ncbi:MAG: tetratricopeptide repeat protein [Alphaproteobacteria bacterium]|nr:tetratricopeptide repeat protein [Alphaproteobacteria bacterium]